MMSADTSVLYAMLSRASRPSSKRSSLLRRRGPRRRQLICCKRFLQSLPCRSLIALLCRDEIPEMIASVDPLNSGFTLVDPQDPRHQYMTDIKGRYGKLLLKASAALRSQGEENILDAVQMLVCLFYLNFVWLSLLLRRFAPFALTCSTMVIATRSKKRSPHRLWVRRADIV